MKLRIVAVLLAPLCSFSCVSTKTENRQETETEEKTATVEPPKLIGRIATIPADKRFVLIQSYGKWEVESGRILTTRGPDERTANLRATGETLGEFAAADLQSGTVQVGDAVYSQHLVKPPNLLTPPQVPQSQIGTPTGNVQKNN